MLAITTSMLTKWESYSQALLARAAPEWRRRIVDGRTKWTPTGFLDHVADADVDYVVHVDEDCFVVDREPLLELIRTMDADRGLVAAGIPDGGHYYRAHNPAALNLFFVVFRASALRQAYSMLGRREPSRFRGEWGDEVLRQRPELDRSRITWDEAEPYYSLFWSLLEQGRVLYLQPILRRDRWSTLVQNSSGRPVAEHLWYLRNWFSGESMPGHDCENRVRYERMQAAIEERHGGDLRFRCSVMCREGLRWLRRAGVLRA